MELRFAHLADYAAQDASGKLTIVGVFDAVLDRLRVRPIPFPRCTLVAKLTGSLGDGPDHKLRIELRDPDERVVVTVIEGHVKFTPSGPGHPIGAQMILEFASRALEVPEVGDYRFCFFLDEQQVGDLLVSVLEQPSVG